MDGGTTAGKIEFLKRVGQLKALKRAGWVKSGVSGPESVADHVRRTKRLLMCDFV